MTNTTPFFELPLYDDNDPANLRDQYNNAMILIDRALHQIKVQHDIDHPAVTPEN